MWRRFCGRLERRKEVRIARRGGWLANARFSPGVGGSPLKDGFARIAPDVVQLHWVNDGFVAIRDLATLRVPVVWTLHDMWPFTGGCHYAGDCTAYEHACGRCPLLGREREEDLSRLGWQRKRDAYARMTLHPVCPSAWLASRARASTLLAGTDVRVIPNGIDTSVFSPGSKQEARQRFGLADRAIWVLGGAAQFREDARKGYDLFLGLARAIRDQVQQALRFVVFGTGRRRELSEDGLSVLELGALDSDEMLAAAYRAADFFVAPSRQDNLPNTLLEALACGTPCASFRIGGIPEIIEDGVVGCLAPAFEVGALAGAVAAVLDDAPRLARMREAAREKATRRYSASVMASDYLKLYEQVLSYR